MVGCGDFGLGRGARGSKILPARVYDLRSISRALGVHINRSGRRGDTFKCLWRSTRIR